ncbi:hypothetical protein HY633_05280 [Candidatus Uhrbacteria bacterium]|nr:hypothetical protein [Candidatus Uhrbacteria bacterium]
MKYRGEEARATDGRTYSENYVETFTHCFGQHPYGAALDALAAKNDFEAIGLFEWLLRRWPEICLESVKSGAQLTKHFWGNFGGTEIAEAFKSIGKAPADFFPIMQRLEAAGILCVVQRGGEIREIELLVPGSQTPE